jgi:hypothetical protein
MIVLMGDTWHTWPDQKCWMGMALASKTLYLTSFDPDYLAVFVDTVIEGAVWIPQTPY